MKLILQKIIMMKISRFSLLVFFIATLLFFQSYGQENNKTEEIFLGIGSGNRKISKIQKSSISPNHTDSITIVDEVKYYLEPKQHQVSYNIENIKPARLKITASGDKLYRGYLKAGAGAYLSPLLDFNYASKRSRDESWGFKGGTNGSFANIKGMGNTKYSDLSFGGYYQKFFMDYDLWSELDYERNNYQFYGLDYQDSQMYDFYGIDSNDSLMKESFQEADSLFKQNYDLFDLHIKLNSLNIGRDSNKLRVKSWIDFHHLNSNYDLSENHFLIGAHSGWLILDEEFLGTFELDINSVNAPETLIINEDNIIQSSNLRNRSSGIIRLNPHIYSRKNNLIVKAGLSIQANINDKAKFHIFPDLELSYSLFNNVFIPYGGWVGNVQRNTFNNIRLENPFISEDANLQNTIQKSNLFAGVRGSLSSKFTFNLSASFQKFDSMYFFTPDNISSYGNKFQMTFDNLSQTSFMGEITYQDSEKLKVSAKGEYFIFDPLNELFAWQKPEFLITLSALLDLSDKIIVKSDIYLVGKRTVFSHHEPLISNSFEDGKYVYNLSPLIDMNLSAEYRYNKKVSGFIQFNNFIGRKYQYWSNFPVQSINILGGVTFSF
ncbi:MAG: hypothetical protein CND37_00670 [Bacteroidetes bacterium MED-G20]|nr:MAG: hypothetical protein CND37_00670 [Bacteroidetes bacterium MED-G20]